MMSSAYIALQIAMILCRHYVIHPLNLLSLSQETFCSKILVFFSSFRKSQVPDLPCQGRAPPVTFLELFTASFKDCQSRIWMLISKAKNASLNLPFYMQLFFRYVLSNSCVSGTLQDTGDAILFGSKEKDRPNAPLSFLELHLINNNKDDDKGDDIIKTINLCGVIMCCQELLGTSYTRPLINAC